jgi:hypothetical protein
LPSIGLSFGKGIQTITKNIARVEKKNKQIGGASCKRTPPHNIQIGIHIMSNLHLDVKETEIQRNTIHSNNPYPSPRFTGLFLPVEILEMEELTPTDIMLLSWIDALYSKEHGGCFASNEYFVKRLRLKENTIRVLITKLVDLGLVERVSFDGRQRILRACKEKWFNRKSQSRSDRDLNHGLQVNIITPCPLLESPPPIYIEKSIDQRLDNSLKVLTPPESKSAKASEVDSIPKKRTPSEFSPKIREVGQKILDLLSQAKPDWPITKNLNPFLTEIDHMIRLEKRDPQKMLDVLAWALADSFWHDKFHKKNPAVKLREHYDSLDLKMNAKPIRKFGTYDKSFRADYRKEKGKDAI